MVEGGFTSPCLVHPLFLVSLGLGPSSGKGNLPDVLDFPKLTQVPVQPGWNKNSSGDPPLHVFLSAEEPGTEQQ